MTTGIPGNGANETPHHPTRRAQEPRLAKSAWLAPHGRSIICTITERVRKRAQPSRGTISSHESHGWERHSWERGRSGAITDSSGSSCSSARPRLLGLRTHSKPISRTIAGLPAWEVLALPRGRNPRLGEMSARRAPCRLTPEVHSKLT